MKLLAEGRESAIYDLGGGRVLRRYKRGGNAEREALVMEHARAYGFPVPAVHEVRADGLVLEQVRGPSMAHDLRRHPWRAGRHARTLASLHHRLHAIPAPAGIATVSEGEALLHLDFHPENVLMSERGPIVIDWTNAHAGSAVFDAAYTWVIVATSDVPRPLETARRLFVDAFVAQFDRADLECTLAAACERRLADPNIRSAERERIRALSATGRT